MERAERLRVKWIEAYRDLRDAGAVCRRFGISRPTLRKWLRRFEVNGNAGLCALSRRPHSSPAAKVGPAEEKLVLDLRRERRLGVKRLRNELRRLHGLHLSSTTVHKILVRHNLSVLPTRRRGRRKPKRYSRPVPGRARAIASRMRRSVSCARAASSRIRRPRARTAHVGSVPGSPWGTGAAVRGESAWAANPARAVDLRPDQPKGAAPGLAEPPRTAKSGRMATMTPRAYVAQLATGARSASASAAPG